MSTPIPWHRLALRRLLQLDHPVPPATDEEVNAEAERNYRWNFTVNLLDGATFWFGTSFVASSTIGPLFISRLTDSPLAVGLLAAVAQGGWFLPQLFTANAVERLARKKPVVVNLGFFLERLPIWLLIPAALLSPRSAGLAVTLFLLGFAMHSIGAGVVATAWQDLIARCFPVEKRGRFMGLTTFIGTGMGTLGAGLSAWLLATFPFPINFAYTFLIAAMGITISWVFLALTREPVQPRRAERQSTRQFWEKLRAIVVSGILVVLEFSAPERRPTYVGLANTSVGVVGALAPLAAAAIGGLSYDLLFALSAIVSLLSLILMRWWVREPRHI